MTLKTRTVTCLTLALSAGLACAQPGAGSHISGLLHQPVGSAVVTPGTDRDSTISNIGSSGNDGVSVQLNTLGGLSCDVAMGPVLATPGAAVRIKYKGWDGLIKARLDCVSSGGGVCAVTCDFSMLGAAGSGVSSLRWIVRDSIGVILAEGDAQGSTSSCVVTDPSFVGTPPLSPPTPTWKVSGHRGKPGVHEDVVHPGCVQQGGVATEERNKFAKRVIRHALGIEDKSHGEDDRLGKAEKSRK